MLCTLAFVAVLDVLGLIRQLGSEDFEKREDAQEQLLTHSWYQIGQTLRFHSADADPEIATRCRRIAGTLRHRALVGLGPMPMIDALWYDRRKHTFDQGCPEFKAYNHLLQKALDDGDTEPGTSWGWYRAATRNLVLDWLDEGKSELAIRLTLVRMHALDTVWIWRARPADPVPLGIAGWQRAILSTRCLFE